MTTLTTLTIVGLVVLAALVVLLLKVLQRDHLNAFLQKRQPTSKVATRAEYVEGQERIPVALSLGSDTIYYENPDLEASFELSRIEHIEYADDLVTGKNIEPTVKVLRLRSHGSAFEFLLEAGEVKKWQAALPPTIVRGSAPQTAQAV